MQIETFVTVDVNKPKRFFLSFFNCYCGRSLIHEKQPETAKILCYFLNSTYFYFCHFFLFIDI